MGDDKQDGDRAACSEEFIGRHGSISRMYVATATLVAIRSARYKSGMAPDRMSRETLLPLLAAYVLENGLADVSLRPLAKAAGTSDRMLLYHFGSKEELVAALLEYLASMYAATLDAAFPDGAAMSRRSLAEAVLRTTAQPDFASFMRVWWDIVAGCADGNAHYLASAGAMADRLLEWIETHLPTDDPNPVAGARAVLAVIEGAMMLRTIGRGDIGEAGLAALES